MCDERMVGGCSEPAARGYKRCRYHLAANRLTDAGDRQWRRAVRSVGTLNDLDNYSPDKPMRPLWDDEEAARVRPCATIEDDYSEESVP